VKKDWKRIFGFEP